MSEVKLPKLFDVVRRMIDTNDQACKLGPLSNIDGARWTKRGTQLTMGWPTNIVFQVLNGDFVGGLLLVERKRFEEVQAEMAKEAKKFPNFAPEDIDALVDRFLGWPLPESVCSDLCVTKTGYEYPRSGTNLLTATEAKAMIEYVLRGRGFDWSKQ